MKFLHVALGGAAGAAGRYAMSLMPMKTVFPLQTFLTNLLGAVLIGFVVGLAEQRPDINPDAVLFLKTGVCGGFTTFSTFSLEALTLLQSRSYVAGGLYIVLSVACCLAGVFCGQKLACVLR